MTMNTLYDYPQTVESKVSIIAVNNR